MVKPDKPTTVAFYGPGDVSAENAKKLIEFWFFAEVIIVFPEEVRSVTNDGLLNVVEACRDVFGSDDISYENDVIDALLDDRKEGQEVELAVLWDSKIDDETRHLVKRARDYDIPVRNMCQALDDLTEDLDTSSEMPLDGPESEPGTIETLPALPVKVKNPRRRTEPPAPVAAPEIGPYDKLEEIFGQMSVLMEQARRVAKELEMPATVVSVEKNPSYVPARQEVRRAYIKSGSEFRPRGRGRPRADEQIVELTDAEAEALGIPVRK